MTVIRLKRLLLTTAQATLEPDHLLLHVRRYFLRPWPIPKDAIAAVVDLRKDLVDPSPERVVAREPNVFNLNTGATTMEPTIGILFRRPVRVPKRRLISETGELSWRKTRSREGQHADAILLRPRDPDAAIAALVEWGVPETEDPWTIHEQVVGVVEDPEEAARLTAEREAAFRKTLRRHRWLLAVVLLLGYLRPMLYAERINGAELAVRAVLVTAFAAAFVGMIRDRAAGRPWPRNAGEFGVVAAVLLALTLATSGLAGTAAALLLWAWVGAGMFVAASFTEAD